MHIQTLGPGGESAGCKRATKMAGAHTQATHVPGMEQTQVPPSQRSEAVTRAQLCQRAMP